MTPVAPAAFRVSLIEAGIFSSAQDHLPRVRLDMRSKATGESICEKPGAKKVAKKFRGVRREK
jgi:hypothetical protein